MLAVLLLVLASVLTLDTRRRLQKWMLACVKEAGMDGQIIDV